MVFDKKKTGKQAFIEPIYVKTSDVEYVCKILMENGIDVFLLE